MSEEKKWPVWRALVHARCPRCRRGNMFANSMYGLRGQLMLKSCSHCGLAYEVEPGYFYVAMLLSYAMSVAEMATIAIGISILTESENPWFYAVVILSIVFIISPFNFRYSRVILLFWLTPGLYYRSEFSMDEPEALEQSQNT